MPASRDFEGLGVFYLGRRVQPESGETTPEPLLYDARDLTTHAVIVGMTGSGKTGLGIGIIEEAVLDGIPVIAIDPKGDLGNLLLAFPKLRPEDFEPWIDPAEAARSGRTLQEEARVTAERWREGLAAWGQGPARVGRFVAAAEARLYTPGGSAGRRLRILRTLAAPPPAVREDAEALRERILGSVSALLGLLGTAADPLRSREHILLTTILERAWGAGRDLDLAGLIHQVQKPPFDRVGVMSLESVFPAAERLELAMSLNNLVASPGFAAWTEGEPLEVSRLLWSEDGRPRISVLNIAHLDDGERMFFVTLLLSEVLAWARSQPGSRSLRAILYMDEIFGYVPPTANPPSKTPMLTLLKQARAYGLGVVLSTQNPVDLDYKGLSNAGTWFIGRLQTERDKARLLDGLEGAAAGESFDRARTERMISGLGKRVFLMNNVHDDAPELFETRWVLSYLAGPLARDGIRRLEVAAEPAAPLPKPGEVAPAAEPGPLASAARPTLPPGVGEAFVPVTEAPAEGEQLVYRPGLRGRVTLHYANARAQLDSWEEGVWEAPLPASGAASPWRNGSELPGSTPELEEEPDSEAGFAELPAAALREASWKRWKGQLATHAYRTRPLELFSCRKPKLTSLPGESEAAFRGRLREALRDERDAKIEKLRRRYAPKLARVRDQIARAEQRVQVEQEQYGQRKMQTAVSVGRTLLGALFGRKLGSVGNIGRAGTAIDRATRAARERGDIERAGERLAAAQRKLRDLEATFQEDLAALEDAGDASDLELRPLRVAPRKSDLTVESLGLAWVPWRIDATGRAVPACWRETSAG